MIQKKWYHPNQWKPVEKKTNSAPTNGTEALGQFRIATIAFHGKFQGVGIEKFPLYHSFGSSFWWQKFLK